MTKPILQSGCLLFCSLIASMPTVAQEIKTDGTTSTTVTSPDGNNFMIEGGDRPEGGARSPLSGGRKICLSRALISQLK